MVGYIRVGVFLGGIVKFRDVGDFRVLVECY